MPAPMSGLVDQLKSLQISQGPGDDYSGSQYTSGGVTWTRDQQTGQWVNPTSSDSQMQSLIDSGAIGYGNTGKFAGNVKQGAQVDFGALPKTVTGQALGDTSGMNFRTGFNVKDGQIDESNWSVRNKSAIVNDPNYGYITANDNVRNKDDWYDTFSGTILPSLIGAGFAAGGGSLIGGLGGGLLRGVPQVGKFIGDEGGNPLATINGMLQGAFSSGGGGGAGGIMDMIRQILSGGG